MKRLIVSCVIIVCCGVSFAMALTGKPTAEKKPPAIKKSAIAAHKKFASVTVTLSGNSLGTSYRIVFNNSSYDHTFPIPNSGSSQVTVPSGNYTVYIGPAIGPGSTHSFSGVSCAVTYGGSGYSVQYNNVDLTCGTASFSVN